MFIDIIEADGRNSMTSESKIYIYATEMVASYYSKLDIKGKTVLTIIGSGDQILNAYFFGAKKVTGFDINQRSLLFVDLKFCAIKHLTYQEFLSFFGKTFSDGSLDKNIYDKIEPYLQVETAKFFNQIYTEAGSRNPLKLEYFRNRTFISCSPFKINAYLEDETSYKKMKKIMLKAEPEFMIGDIVNIAVNLQPNTYDIINLSNIPNYFVGRNERRITIFLQLLQSFERAIIKEGIIFFYSYTPAIYQDGVLPPASRQENIDKIKEMGLFFINKIEFTGTEGKENDWVTILKKKTQI
ncbi:MAG TPA: DUF3419 family protein [Candidatus Paceibacterota bacterium]